MHATRTAEVEAAYLMPHLFEGQRLLDVGCGPGTMTVGFAKHVGAAGHVTAIDTVDAVLEQAQEALANAQNATVEKASVYELPYVRESSHVSACPTAAPVGRTSHR
jgi:ubiquinone/menaquinone biosynthesis C-methylase UbiE